MEELIVQHDIVLTSNITTVRQAIVETIDKYSSVVVTEDSVNEAKELMALFNKQKKAFVDQCKSVLALVSAPIDAFKREQKEVEALYDQGREKIGDQVKVFESCKLEQISLTLNQYRYDECVKKGINPNSVVVTDLQKLTAATATKNGYSLTKSTREAINLRIQAVENEMLRAKLAAEEVAKREREIAEQARIEAEERARKREAELLANAEREKIAAVERAKMELQQAASVSPKAASVSPKAASPASSGASIQPEAKGVDQESVASVGKSHFKVTVTLEINTQKPVLAEQVKAVVSKKFADAGFSTVKDIFVA